MTWLSLSHHKQESLCIGIFLDISINTLGIGIKRDIMNISEMEILDMVHYTD